MTEEERLKIRIENILKNPKQSKQVLFEFEQFLGRTLMETNGLVQAAEYYTTGIFQQRKTSNNIFSNQPKGIRG